MQETENQLSQTSLTETKEPEIPDNSLVSQANSQNFEDEEGKSQDPSTDLILGKFKSIDDLSKAYCELQKQQGKKSEELGKLRKDASSVADFTNSLQKTIDLQNCMKDYLNEYRTKYDKPEYFQDLSFRTIYKEAFLALGQNLDTDKFISLLENYVSSRISAYEKTKSAQKENQTVINRMSSEPENKTGFAPVKKSFDEMSDKEVDELLERLI